MKNEAFLALLEKLGSEQTAQDDFYRILSGIRDHIRDLPEIRIYVDNSPNFGHQASTIALMRQFIDWSGYQNKITVFFNTDADSLSTQNKLALLFPGVDVKKLTQSPGSCCLSYKTCHKITFAMITSGSRVTPDVSDFIPFGFTGGSDRSWQTHELLKVNYFLCLQPYMWHGQNRIEIFPKPEGAEEPPVIDLEETVGKHLKKALYLYDEKELSSPPQSVWDWYENGFCVYNKISPGSVEVDRDRTEKFRLRVKNARRIPKITSKYKARLWPIYGLQNYRHHCENLTDEISVPYDITGEILFNLVLCGLMYQCQCPCPIVMLLFNTIIQNPVHDFDLDQESLFGYINAFINSSQDLEDYFQRKDLRPIVSSRDKYSYTMVQPDIHTAGVVEEDVLELRKIFQPASSSKLNTIHILECPEEATGLENGHLYIIKTGPMPMDLFNYFFWNADMPPFFEGQGTSSLTILTGRPFFQCSQAYNYHSYPTSVFSGDSVDPFGRPIYDMVMLFVKRFLTWEGKGSYSRFIQNLSRFIADAYTPHTREYDYFQALKETYGAPNHSKFFLGLITMFFTYKNSLLDLKSPASQRPDSPPASLEDVYETLTLAREVGHGSVDLLKTLTGTRLAEYFEGVSQGSFTALIPPDSIEKTYDPGKALCQVSVKDGSVSLSHMDFSFSLVFSYAQYTRALISEFHCVSREDWSFPGMPWVCLENFGFQTLVAEGNVPISGCLTGTLKGTDLNLSIPFPVDDGALTACGEFSHPVSVLEPFYRIAGGINFIQSMPDSLKTLGGFGLKSLSFVYSLKEKTCLSMDFILETDKPWTIMKDPDFSIKPQVKVSIAAPGDLKNRRISFQIGGQFAIEKGVILVTASCPDFQIHARLMENEIDLNAFVKMFGGSIDLKSSISAFCLDILPGEQMFFLAAGVQAHWNLFDLLTIRSLSFYVSRDQTDTGLFLSGQMTLLPDTLPLDLYVQGSWHSSSKGWRILARQSFSGKAQAGAFLSHYLGWNPGRLDLPVADIEFMTDTSAKSWQITAGVCEGFSVPFLKDVTLDARFAFGKEKSADGRELSHALVSAGFTWNGIELLIWYDYDPDVLNFGFTWNGLTATVSQNQDSQWVGTLCFTEETTVGSMIETMVSWIRGSRFGLEAPWDLLDKIPLPALELEYNFTTGQVSFQVSIGQLDLGFARITGIQAAYVQEESNNKNRQVQVSLTGDFPWNTGESALGDTHCLGPWDASAPGQAPAPSGSGNKYFNLRLFALGQHVTMDGLSSVTKVEDAVSLMENMPDLASSNRYDPDSAWIMGADLQILKLTGKGENGYLLTVQTVFNDPVFYALRVALAGQEAKILAGLEFQILYKKLKDNLGVYQAEITLPDSARYLNLGGFNITLPIISIAVYTNGDFQVDIGFPWNHDFSRSFSIEALVYPGLPLTGCGGFYFGVLSGETCSRVPQSPKGSFQPVLTLGLGLKVGLGKSLRFGILDAAFSLTATGILEGILAKWNPYETSLPEGDSHSLDSSYYYCLLGTVGVAGWLFAKVDFGIIKASVQIAISLMADFRIEACQPALLSVTCQVEICLRLSINLGLFRIAIHLSFSAEVPADFQIEARGQAPWLAESLLPVKSNMVYISEESPEPVSLDAYLVTALTVAHDEWESLTAAPDARHLCYVAVMFLEFDSFALLCRALLDWVLTSYPDALAAEDPDALSMPLSKVTEFLNNRVRITIHEQPLPRQDQETGLVDTAVYFPMVPWLNLEAGSDLSYTFARYNEVSSQKLDQLRTYFDQLAVAAWDEGRPMADDEESCSMAEWVFADYFLMLSRQLLKYSLDEAANGRGDQFFEGALNPDAIRQLAAMTTRYSLHGLRLATDGIRPLTKGIWVNDEKQLPPFAGLFSLTGQQFIIPSRFEPDRAYTVSFTMPHKLSWLDFESGKNTYVISVSCDSPDAKRIEHVADYWKERVLSHQMVYRGAQDMVQKLPLAFTFSSRQMALAFEGLPLGADMDAKTCKELCLWKFPDALLNLTASRPRGIRLSLSLKEEPLTHYRPGCVISFGVQKAALENCPMYEITGGKAQDILLLERVVSALPALDDVTIKVGYASPDGPLTIDGDQGLFTSFVKVNLSTETSPSDAGNYSCKTQDAQESIRTLWQALITNRGGFYLYYCRCQDGQIQGLPDSIFDEKGRTALSLLILPLWDKKDRQATVTNYMNTFVTAALSLEPEISLLAQTVLESVDHVITDGRESIDRLCQAYDSAPGDFAEQNPDIRLNKGIPIRIEQGVYLAQNQKAPGRDLKKIQAFFGVTLDQLKAANPRRIHWPDLLDEGEALALPPMTIVTDEKELSSLTSISEKYGCDTKLLAALNRDTPGLLSAGQSVHLMGGLKKYVPVLTPGTAAAAFTVTPPAPGTDPQTEALALIMDQYTLLGYHVMENDSYTESNLALPAGPGEKDGSYCYTIALPLTGLTKGPGPDRDNPYNVVGTFLQLDCHWQDLFGNVTASQFSLRDPIPGGFINGLPMFQGYTDQLLPISSWPGVTVSYWVEAQKEGQPCFQVQFLFDTEKYEELPNAETRQKYAALARKQYQSLYFQMTDPLGVEFQVTTSLLLDLTFGKELKSLLYHWLFGGPGSVCDYLQGLEKGERPVPPRGECLYTFPFDLSMINDQDLYPLTCAIEWHRLKRLAAGEFASMDGVFAASSTLPPKADAKGSLSGFAQNLEQALRDPGNFRYRLAVGFTQTSETPNQETLWLTRQGETPGAGIHVTFLEDSHVLAALRPISNRLEARDSLRMPVYETGIGLVPQKTAPPMDFRAIDLDIWMKTFVTALEDELLSPRMVMAVIRIDTITGSSFYDELTELKQQLAFALKDYLIPVLEKDREKNLDFVREHVRQQLLTRLSSFYEIQGVLETRAAVSRGPKIRDGEMDLKLFGTVTPGENTPLSQMSLSNTKLMLRPGHQPFACFINCPDLARDRSGAILPGITLDPVFTGSHLEHGFHFVEGIDHYEASGWLSFVTGDSGGSFCQKLGEFYMPLLLRSYPETPLLGNQDYVFNQDPDQDIPALTWDFRFQYKRSCHYPQDQVEAAVHFNRKNDAADGLEENRLFDSLAAFVSLYPQIKDDLETYALKVQPDMDKASRETVCGHQAIGSFITLSSQVIKAVQSRPSNQASVTDAGVTYSFCLRESVEEIQGIRALVIRVEGAPPAGLPWPVVSLGASDIETVLWKKEACTIWYWFKDTAAGRPLEAFRGQLIPCRRLCFPGLYLLCWQSAFARISVRRNHQKIGESQVDAPFIYQTGSIGFHDTLYPFMDIGGPVDLPAFSGSGESPKALCDHLTAFFERLLKRDPALEMSEISISLEAAYAYRTAPDGCFTELPVFLQPSVLLNAGCLEAHIRMWSQALADWREKHIALSSDLTWNENSLLCFNLTVFSHLADTPMPLLHLHKLQLPGKYISSCSIL